MTGGQCLGSLADLYDVAGQIRATLMELQRETRLAGCAGGLDAGDGAGVGAAGGGGTVAR